MILFIQKITLPKKEVIQTYKLNNFDKVVIFTFHPRASAFRTIAR